MKDDTRELLDSLLSEWHRWAQGFSPVAGHGTSAMFTGVRSSRQWDSQDDVNDGGMHNTQMKAIDFNVGELCDVYRTALQFNARNLATGRAVWTSPRLPTDLETRAQVLGLARSALIARLRDAGVV